MSNVIIMVMLSMLKSNRIINQGINGYHQPCSMQDKVDLILGISNSMYIEDMHKLTIIEVVLVVYVTSL